LPKQFWVLIFETHAPPLKAHHRYHYLCSIKTLHAPADASSDITGQFNGRHGHVIVTQPDRSTLVQPRRGEENRDDGRHL